MAFEIIEALSKETLRRTPRRWWVVRRDGKPVVKVSCPYCGQIGDLSDHEIDSQGLVSPSLLCWHNGCDFHEHVKLVGWDPTRGK